MSKKMDCINRLNLGNYYTCLDTLHAIPDDGCDEKCPGYIKKDGGQRMPTIDRLKQMTIKEIDCEIRLHELALSVLNAERRSRVALQESNTVTVDHAIQPGR